MVNGIPSGASPTEVANMTEFRELSEQILALSGKVDTYMAQQNVTLLDHGRRITDHDLQIDRLRNVASTHVTRAELRDALVSALPAKVQTTGWTMVGTVVQGIVGMGTLLGIGILLIQTIAK